MSSIPGHHPAEVTPPPGSQTQVVTAASLSRLMTKLAELERRVALLERK